MLADLPWLFVFAWPVDIEVEVQAAGRDTGQHRRSQSKTFIPPLHEDATKDTAEEAGVDLAPDRRIN